MSLFSKAEYENVTLPFVCVLLSEDFEASTVGIEASGIIKGEQKFFYACYQVNPEYFDEITGILKLNNNKNIIVTLKIKKDKIKDFTIDLSSLADTVKDERIKDFELVCWGINDKSVITQE